MAKCKALGNWRFLRTKKGGGERINWQEQAIKMYLDGKSWTRITEQLSPFMPGLTPLQAKERIRGAVRRSEEYQAKRAKPEKIVEKPKKIEVVQNLEPETLEVNWRGNRIVRFALISDTHLNSKYTQITHLHQFYDECQREGIKHVYLCGDIDEGEQMRMGHQYECYTQGADDHVAEIVRVYPKRQGMATHFITGNHDASITKRCGHNIGPRIAEQRPDMKYLGSDCAIVKLTPNCTLELRHPWDGSAYAISYKIQKMIDAMAGGEKPNILAVGHYHKAEYLFYRNIHAFQAGCFQGQTPFTRSKGISVHMGGWIVEIEVDADGYIDKIKQQLIPYYTAIAEDYRGWRET